MEEAENELWVETKNLSSQPWEQDMRGQIHINSYFHTLPSKVLGQMKPVSTQFGYDIACVPDDNPAPISERIVEAMEHINTRYQPAAEEMPRPV